MTQTGYEYMCIYIHWLTSYIYNMFYIQMQNWQNESHYIACLRKCQASAKSYWENFENLLRTHSQTCKGKTVPPPPFFGATIGKPVLTCVYIGGKSSQEPGGQFWIKRGRNHPWVKGFQVCSNKGPGSHQRGDHHI
jgi:hypothetical protein